MDIGLVLLILAFYRDQSASSTISTDGRYHRKQNVSDSCLSSVMRASLLVKAVACAPCICMQNGYFHNQQMRDFMKDSP